MAFAKRMGTAAALAALVAVTVPIPASAETLREALAAAYRNNPSLDAQRARLRATNEQVPQALANYRPRVSATADVGYRKIYDNSDTTLARTGAGSDQNLAPRVFGAEVQQPLYRGGRTLAETRRAENTVRQERARLTSTEQDTLTDAVVSYTDVYRSQLVLALTISNEQRLARQYEATRDRFRVGEVTRTDVFQAEARLAQATAQRIAAEGTLEQSRAAYRNVIGEAPGVLDAPPLPDDLPISLAAAVQAAIGGNPVIRQQEFAERAALDTVDQQKGALLPSVNLVGRAERSYEEAREDAEFDTLEALVQVTVPLYTGGADYARIRAAKQTAAEQRRLIDQSRNDAVQAATQGWSQLETARAQIGSLSKQVEANAIALDGVQREAEVGARTVLDVLDAEQELLQSQVDLVTAQRDEVVAAYRLKSSLGDLTARKLGLDVDYYDPEQHYRDVRNSWFGGSSQGDVSSDFARPVRER
ncbi:MAG: TolC family outer membrane protein [Rhodospirillales bacterium]|jgi:outer membrane protein|nr:TolC family outer membrane protein [Rhodospirillales bacterium]